MMLGRPCARCTTSAGSKPCRSAKRVHTRATAGVESISTPSISRSKAAQEIRIIRGSACAQCINQSFLHAQGSIKHTDAKAFPQTDDLNFPRRKRLEER